MSKKIMSIMLAIFMLASLCVVGFSSASAASVPDNSTDGNYAKAGDIIEFSMVVDLEGCWGQNGQIETYYDATKLKFLKYSNDEEKAYTFPVISATGAFMPNLTGKFGTDDKGYVGLHVNYTNATGGYDYASADGVVFRYRFEVLEDVTNLSDLIYCQVDVFKVFTVPGNPEYSDGAIGSEVDLVKAGTLSDYLVGGACSITGGSEEPTTAPSEETTEPSEETTAPSEETTEATDSSEEPTEATDPTEEPTEATDPSEEETTAEDTTAAEETTTADDTTAEDTTAATTEAPEAPQTGDSATAVALMVVAIMAAGVVIFARKKAVR